MQWDASRIVPARLADAESPAALADVLRFLLWRLHDFRTRAATGTPVDALLLRAGHGNQEPPPPQPQQQQQQQEEEEEDGEFEQAGAGVALEASVTTTATSTVTHFPPIAIGGGGGGASAAETLAGPPSPSSFMGGASGLDAETATRDSGGGRSGMA